jgi:midasin
VSRSEPVLLVGETGVGKTASVQFLARETGRRLTVVNINQQSDAMDLLGGYKPLEIKHTIRPVREEFEDLFFSTFDGDKNAKFLHYVSVSFYV